MIQLNGQESSALCFIARAPKSREARRAATRLTGHAASIAKQIMVGGGTGPYAPAAKAFLKWATNP